MLAPQNSSPPSLSKHGVGVEPFGQDISDLFFKVASLYMRLSSSIPSLIFLPLTHEYITWMGLDHLTLLNLAPFTPSTMVLHLEFQIALTFLLLLRKSFFTK